MAKAGVTRAGKQRFVARDRKDALDLARRIMGIFSGFVF
eukprot:COSAG02_NODE_49217_length_328_cov_0.777293_1_plen_38_part_10